MGIAGLLPLLSEIAESKSLEAFRGQTLGVDAYVWLHRGCYACAQEIALHQPTLKYVTYAMGKIRMLKYFGITPYVVFDGGLLPSKMGTETERALRRSDALKKANALSAEGKTAQAREYYIKACDVSPQHAYQLIKELKKENIAFVVAPYEADAQLAFLEKKRLIDGIITEDSDLLVFGCRNVLYKMNAEGQVVHINRDKLANCREYRFDGWSDTEFRHMAILSGCDYLDSIQGVGLKTAHQLMRRHRTAKKAIQTLRLNSKFTVPITYDKAFRCADLTFLYQCVFDPTTHALCHLNDLPQPCNLSVEEISLVGASLNADLVRGIARGDVDPLTKKPMIDIFPRAQEILHKAQIHATQTFKKLSSSTNSNGKQKFVIPEHGARDIRNFFFAGGSDKEVEQKSVSRKALKVVPVNLADSKAKRKSLVEPNQGPLMTSKFFDSSRMSTSMTNAQTEVETVIISDSEEESNLEELSVPAEEQSPMNGHQTVLQLTMLDPYEEQVAEDRWNADHQIGAQEEIELADLSGEAIPDEDVVCLENEAGARHVSLPVHERSNMDIDPSPAEQMSDIFLTDPASPSLADFKVQDCSDVRPLSELSSSQSIVTSPTRKTSQNPLNNNLESSYILSSPPQLILSPGKTNSQSRKRKPTSSTALSDYSEPLTPQANDQPEVKPRLEEFKPLARTTSRTKSIGQQRKAKLIAAMNHKDEDEDTEEHIKAIEAVTASWRAKFMMGNSVAPPTRQPASLQKAVSKAIASNKKPRLSAADRAKPRWSISPPSALQPAQDQGGTPTPWRKVVITEGNLKQFAFRR